MFKSGFISIIGRPNAGKSTLLNCILQEKVAIMSEKAQTTRNNIMGILTKEDVQYVFIDTPGIHKPHHELGRNLNRSAYQAIVDADITLLLVDATQAYGSGDAFLIERLKQYNHPCFLVLNKIDLLNKQELLEVLNSWTQHFDFDEIIPISAKCEDNIEQLLKVIKDYLKEGVAFFPKDMTCDHDELFMIQEIIREKVLWKTKEEVPHSIAVVVEHMKEEDTNLKIQAMVVVERASQKAIVIGKQANRIREIRLLAQKELKNRYQKKVDLELFVKVENNWRNKLNKLAQFGYQSENE